jgi:DNA-binding response OmpR family regulator
VRALVIEDNPKMSEAVQKGLRDNGFDVDSARTGFEGEEMASSGSYDVILLDLMLPDSQGVDICRNLRRRGVTSKVMMVTALSATKNKVTGLDAGADDYITKPFEFDELLARLRALLRRGDASEARYLRRDDLELDLYARVAKRGDRTVELSNRESALLEYLMRNPGRVLSRTQIGEKVWAMAFEPTSNVVDVYVSALRKKIADDGAPASGAPGTASALWIPAIGQPDGMRSSSRVPYERTLPSASRRQQADPSGPFQRSGPAQR